MIDFKDFGIKGMIVITHWNDVFWTVGFDERGLKGWHLGSYENGIFKFKNH